VDNGRAAALAAHLDHAEWRERVVIERGCLQQQCDEQGGHAARLSQPR
jgi:hypothetical protein